MKVSLRLLTLAVAGAMAVAITASAYHAQALDTTKKETKWQGRVVRVDKEHSMIDINGGPAPSKEPRKVAFDSSTEWTEMGKSIQPQDLKAGEFIIFLGHVDDKGVLHATRIDRRKH